MAAAVARSPRSAAQRNPARRLASSASTQSRRDALAGPVPDVPVGDGLLGEVARRGGPGPRRWCRWRPAGPRRTGGSSPTSRSGRDPPTCSAVTSDLRTRESNRSSTVYSSKPRRRRRGWRRRGRSRRRTPNSGPTPLVRRRRAGRRTTAPRGAASGGVPTRAATPTAGGTGHRAGPRTSCGLIDTIRAAASSIANAIPSSRRQISVTAVGVGRRRRSAKPGFTARARSTNNSTAAEAAPARDVERGDRPQVLGADPQALPRGGDHLHRRRCGPGSSRPGRRRRPARARSCPTPPAAAGPTGPGAMLSVTVEPACGVMPKRGGHHVGHRGGVADGGQLDQPHPVGELRHQLGGDLRRRGGSCRPRPRRSASPADGPGPARRAPSPRPRGRRSWSAAPAGSPAPRPRSATAGTLDARPSARTWNRMLAPDRSRSRCSPRSTSSTPCTSAAVDAATRIWPPCPAAMTRAARFNAGPK